jgi:hypothetical protein
MKAALTELAAVTAVCAIVLLAAIMIAGPTAHPHSLAFRIAMRIWAGV